jgi:hypothetical protein
VKEQLDRIEEQVFEAGLILMAAARPAPLDQPGRVAEPAENLSLTKAQSAALT